MGCLELATPRSQPHDLYLQSSLRPTQRPNRGNEFYLPPAEHWNCLNVLLILSTGTYRRANIGCYYRRKFQGVLKPTAHILALCHYLTVIYITLSIASQLKTPGSVVVLLVFGLHQRAIGRTSSRTDGHNHASSLCKLQGPPLIMIRRELLTSR